MQHLGHLPLAVGKGFGRQPAAVRGLVVQSLISGVQGDGGFQIGGALRVVPLAEPNDTAKSAVLGLFRLPLDCLIEPGSGGVEIPFGQQVFRLLEKIDVFGSPCP